jgi:hypothetical protein
MGFHTDLSLDPTQLLMSYFILKAKTYLNRYESMSKRLSIRLSYNIFVKFVGT